MNHYSFRYIYHLVYMAFSINWSWSLHADEKKGGDSFSHTNRGGTLECRWRCHIHLHHSGKLWVFNLGLDRIVQGERETERKKKVDWWTKTQKETKMRSESQSGSLTSGDLYLCVQIGFKRASDYSTFAWVKDDEVAANGEVVTVWQTKSFSVENRN